MYRRIILFILFVPLLTCYAQDTSFVELVKLNPAIRLDMR